MNDLHTRMLVERFPTFWALDKFMFECEDGWFELIYNLCLRLEASRFSGRCIQLKEKWGELRFYVDTPPFGKTNLTPEQRKIIWEAEAESEYWCEICGSPSGSLRKDTAFVQTRCDACHETYLHPVQPCCNLCGGPHETGSYCDRDSPKFAR